MSMWICRCWLALRKAEKCIYFLKSHLNLWLRMTCEGLPSKKHLIYGIYSFIRAWRLSRHGQTLHLVLHPAEFSDQQGPSLLLWSLPMESVVQLLKNLQFWNPEQTQVGVSFVAFLCALEGLEDEVSNIRSATLSNGGKKTYIYISQSKNL